MRKETLEKIDKLIDAACDSITEKIESKNHCEPCKEVKALAELITARATIKPTITASEIIDTQSMIKKKSKYRFRKLRAIDTIIK